MIKASKMVFLALLEGCRLGLLADDLHASDLHLPGRPVGVALRGTPGNDAIIFNWETGGDGKLLVPCGG